jgi:hypothetical protein
MNFSNISQEILLDDGRKEGRYTKNILNIIMKTELWKSTCALYAFGKFMKYIMNYALSNLLQIAQYTAHNLRDLNNIYVHTPELYTTVLPKKLYGTAHDHL